MSSINSSFFRALTVGAVLCVAIAVRAQSAQPAYDPDSPQQLLLESANAERAKGGLPPLVVDPALTLAAQRHADLMAEQQSLEHQLPGEASLLQRASVAGAHFTSLGENIASAGTINRLHTAWVNSPPHYANLMSPGYTAIGIGVAHSGNHYFGVEDFSAAVEALSPSAIEDRIRDMLAVRNIQPIPDSSYARKACLMKDGLPQGAPQPSAVLRFAGVDVASLGPVLDQRLSGQSFTSAAVGVCADPSHGGFARFRVAVLLY
jgi:hypothetical protein